MQLVELLSEGLSEEDGSHINSYFREPCVGSVRLNYYPASATIGLPAHTDVAAFVLLHQCDGGEGLQVEKNGQWVTVQARSDAFVVIMGTVYQVMHIILKYLKSWSQSFNLTCTKVAQLTISE